MPFINTVEFNYAFVGKPAPAPAPAGNLPSYYTVNSGFLMYQPGYNSATLQLKTLANINTATVIRTYTGMVSGA